MDWARRPTVSAKREARHSFDLSASRVPEIDVGQVRAIELPESIADLLHVVCVDLRRSWIGVERLLYKCRHLRQDEVCEAPSCKRVGTNRGDVLKIHHAAHVLAVVEGIGSELCDFRAKLDELAHRVSSLPVVSRRIARRVLEVADVV